MRFFFQISHFSPSFPLTPGPPCVNTDTSINIGPCFLPWGRPPPVFFFQTFHLPSHAAYCNPSLLVDWGPHSFLVFGPPHTLSFLVKHPLTPRFLVAVMSWPVFPSFELAPDFFLELEAFFFLFDAGFLFLLSLCRLCCRQNGPLRQQIVFPFPPFV